MTKKGKVTLGLFLHITIIIWDNRLTHVCYFTKSRYTFVSGLVVPVVAQRLMGGTGEILMILMILMAVTSTGSAEIMALLAKSCVTCVL